MENTSVLSKQIHHERQELCTNRPRYRQGRKLTAVKVKQTINIHQSAILTDLFCKVNGRTTNGDIFKRQLRVFVFLAVTWLTWLAQARMYKQYLLSLSLKPQFQINCSSKLAF